MAENSAIEWTDHTFNPWEGCQKVGPGCDHCYAETRNARFGGGAAPNWGPGAPRRLTSAANWRKPLAWNAAGAAFAEQHGRRQRVFCASLADVFDNAVEDMWRADLANLIDATPNLDWLLLTKRIGNAADMLEIMFDSTEVRPNVWVGATVVNQAEADRDIPKLLATPADVRFLSIEPMLGPIDLSALLYKPCPNSLDGLNMDPSTGQYECCSRCDWTGIGEEPAIDWIICGGESGAGARPMHPDWARSLRDQCAAAGVPFLFKQWGEWREWDDGSGNPEPEEVDNDSEVADFIFKSSRKPAFIAQDGRVFERKDLPEEVPCRLVERVGKKLAGRTLDGVQHDGVPA